MCTEKNEEQWELKSLIALQKQILHIRYIKYIMDFFCKDKISNLYPNPFFKSSNLSYFL